MTKQTILVVEDDERSLKDLERLLRKRGYEVLLAMDEKGALTTIEKEDINLVLLDIRLETRKEGINVLKRAMELKPILPVVMMTGFDKIPSAVESIKLGAYDFVEKPILDLDRFWLIVKNALEKDKTEREKISLIRSRMVGASAAMRRVLELIEKIAPANSDVLITGESGTGKELVARAVHDLSDRMERPFVVVDCPAIPEGLIESELFGHARGSFTGAIADHTGMFEQADGGTLFLDEIGDMALTTQSKVLRAIETREIQRIGEAVPRKVDVRIIAATNKRLEDLMKTKQFREDLFYRLNVVTIHIPPLRERRDDIVALADHFLRQACEENGYRRKTLAEDARLALMQYEWPGNVRELKNFVKRLAILIEADSISQDHVLSLMNIQPDLQFDFKGSLNCAMEAFEKQFLTIRLIANNWNFSKTADELQIDRATLYRKAKHYGIEKQN